MDPVVIIGAGPAGVAAAYELSRKGAEVVIVEADEAIGGLSRTLSYKGALFDVGPHRFFTKNKEILGLWSEALGPDFVDVDRLTRIFYRNQFFNYPIALGDTLKKVGPGQAASFGFSYLGQRVANVFSHGEPESFEDWVVGQFGRSLFNAFFKTYTEKVWGIPCSQIGAEWAGQRIKGLSLSEVVRNAIFKPKEKAKTLVEQFKFPRLGAGMMYERIAQMATECGAKVLLGTKATGIRHEKGRAVAVQVQRNGQTEDIACSYVLTSNPLTEVALNLQPAAPAEILEAARALRYRCHLSVNLLVEGDLFPDNWIYVHAREVVLCRVASYANFSDEMRTKEGLHPITVEYFQFPEDELYSNPSTEALVEFAKRELKQMGIVQPEQVRDGFVVRSRYAYPVLEIGYVPRLEQVKSYLGTLTNLQPIGRAGMFKYNNQDHSIATGLFGARKVLGQDLDVWAVNIDAEYHESGEAQ
ncbi:FAD-dependent oxidoreductase [bacterium]|nr:FAD-dependent oxidoreductase [bacterium]